jgi:hypothetical protein
VQMGISRRKGAFTFNDLPLIVRTPFPYRPIFLFA